MNDLKTKSGLEFENQQRAARQHGGFLGDFLVGEGVERALHALGIDTPARADILAIVRNTLATCCWPSWWSMAVSCSW
jgi:hypothetical protein